MNNIIEMKDSTEFQIVLSSDKYKLNLNKIDGNLKLINPKNNSTLLIGQEVYCENKDELEKIFKICIEKIGKRNRPYRIVSLILFIIMCSISAFSQNDWYRGYEDGFKAGYCHNQNGCVSPPAPAAILSADYINTYTGGYNNGFARGMTERNSKSQNASTDRKRYETSNPIYVEDALYKTDYEMVEKLLQKKQETYNKINSRRLDLMSTILVILRENKDNSIKLKLNAFYRTLENLTAHNFKESRDEIVKIENELIKLDLVERE